LGDGNCSDKSEKARMQKGNDAKKAFETSMALVTKGLSPGQTTQEMLKNIIDETKKYLSDANPFVKKYVSDSLAQGITSLIEATGPPTDGSSGNSMLTQQARAGLAFLQAAAGVGDAFSDPPRVPHPNALAAAHAWLQYIKDTADLDIAEARTECDVNEATLAAVTAQVYFLSRAGEEFQKIPTDDLAAGKGLAEILGHSKDLNKAVAATLVYYAEAWNRGITRAMEIEREQYLLQRRAKLERSRRAGSAWVGTIKPGVDTLASYGAGGIDPQVIANLLQAIGVGAIAGGVNR